jgi:hypothetical protein
MFDKETRQLGNTEQGLVLWWLAPLSVYDKNQVLRYVTILVNK